MPTATATEQTIHTMEFSKEESVEAPIEIVWESLLEQLGPESEIPGGKKFPLKLEAWVGGRWFRDLGNNTGHLWGHVQVIKPPNLIELCGPIAMSYPAMNHIQYRLTAEGKSTKLKLTHKAMGMIIPEHREMDEAWEYILHKVVENALRKVKK